MLTKHTYSMHEGKDDFTCQLCGKVFIAMKGNLMTHLSAVHEGRKDTSIVRYVKKPCTAERSRKTYLYSAVHEGRKDFQCQLCDQAFTRQESIKRHISTVHEVEFQRTVPFGGKFWPNRTEPTLPKLA